MAWQDIATAPQGLPELEKLSRILAADIKHRDNSIALVVERAERLLAGLLALPEAVALASDQSDDGDLVARITEAVREADHDFERVGGSSRHWVRDCFLPSLRRHALIVSALPPPPSEEPTR